MEKLIDYINEKFLINKNTKKSDNSNLLDIIYNCLNINQNHYKPVKLIQKWIQDNNIDKVQPVSDEETLHIISKYQIIDKKYLNLFSTMDNHQEICAEFLEKIKNPSYSDDNGDLYISRQLIAQLGYYGSLFILNINNKS